MKKYIALVAIVLLAGCASAGNEKVRTETMDSVATKVTKGVTTKNQIREMYGEPTNVSLTDGGGEVWNYEYTHTSARAVNFVPIVNLFAMAHDIDKNQVVFIFDKKDVVQNYTVHALRTDAHVWGSDIEDNQAPVTPSH